MLLRTAARLACAVGMLILWSPGEAQDLALAVNGPRFLYASAERDRPVEVDIARSALLRRRVSLAFDRPTVGGILTAISQQTGLEFVYSRETLPVERIVGLRADSITVAAALTELLVDTGLDVLLSPGRQVVLARRADLDRRLDTGTIAGRVTDAKTGFGVAGARVTIDGTGLGALTNDSGGFRMANVPVGTFTVTVRRIGYAQGVGSVTVAADEEAVIELKLELSASLLDVVVVTGTVVPTEVKALPTPVSVITAEDFAVQRPHSLQELFRQTVPTAVAWDEPAYPARTAFSARGASTIGGGGNGQMKVFIDGIPMSDNTFGSVDPSSIERVEVIRGPQAAAIYGSDALGGVLQIFTKRGDFTSTRPAWDGEAALGVVQTPYAGYESVVRQAYRASVAGGSPEVSYQFGAGYTHTPDWVVPVTSQSQASVRGGVHVARGILTADLSGRYYSQRLPGAFNPELASTGLSFVTKPFFQPTTYRSQTLGAKLTLAPTAWWPHTITVGIDRFNQDNIQTQPRLTSSADTFLTAYNNDETKTFIAYNNSIQGRLGASATGSVTVGFDHYSLAFSSWFTSSALSTSPSTGSFGLARVTRTVTNNTGYFAQAQLGLWDALFLTGGVRAEENTNFGDALGTPVSPQAGLTYVRPVGPATLKLRGSWGRAIRPPSPGAKVGGTGPTSTTLPNPALGPEHQQGWDAGVDATFGGRGSLSATYFNQTATDLIALLTVAVTPVTTYQNQNVGRVKNRGVEFEASLALGILDLRGQYAYVHSRVEDPGAATGVLLPGDQLNNIPTHTAGASVSLAPRSGTTVAAGATYVGEWVGINLPVYYRCLAGTGPCLSGPGTRPYRTMLPSLFKVNATVSQQITTQITGFVSVDNLTNNTRHEFVLSNAVMGRITTVGLRLNR